MNLGSTTRCVARAGARIIVVALACTLGAGMAHANPKVEDHGPPVILVGPDCDHTDYKGEQRQFVPPLAIPDNNPVGILTPPIVLPADGDIINDVIIQLQMSHTWIGDLIVTVTYDPDCNGPQVQAPVSATILCRPDVTGDPTMTPAPCGDDDGAVGCGSDLSCNNTYSFSDDATASLGIGAFCGATSATVLPTGCYKPSPVGGTPLSVFRGLLKGGCWTLAISDNAAIDTGSLCSWAVFVRNQKPVPAQQASWGHLKSQYR
jgi:hypothetical protein